MSGTSAVFASLLLTVTVANSPQTRSPKYSHKQAIAALKAEGYRLQLTKSDTLLDKYPFENGEISKEGWRARIGFSYGASSSTDTSGKTVNTTYATAIFLNNQMLLSKQPNRIAIMEWAAAQNWPELKIVPQFNQIVNIEFHPGFMECSTDVLQSIGRFKNANLKFAKMFNAEQIDPCEIYPVGAPVPDSTPLPGICLSELDAIIRLNKWEWKPSKMNHVDRSNELGGVINLGTAFGIDAFVEGIEISFDLSYWEPNDSYTVHAIVPVESGVNAKTVALRMNGGKPYEYSSVEIDKGIGTSGFHDSYFSDKTNYYVLIRHSKLKNSTLGQFREDIVKFARKIKDLPRR